MMKPDLWTGYFVRVSVRDGRFELSIPELLILARSTDLDEAYRLLLETKAEAIEWARMTGGLDKLPQPSPL